MSELLVFLRELAAGQSGDYADFLDALLPVEAWEVARVAAVTGGGK
jgi:hypothetical protein